MTIQGGSTCLSHFKFHLIAQIVTRLFRDDSENSRTGDTGDIALSFLSFFFVFVFILCDYYIFYGVEK